MVTNQNNYSMLGVNWSHVTRFNTVDLMKHMFKLERVREYFNNEVSKEASKFELRQALPSTSFFKETSR